MIWFNSFFPFNENGETKLELSLFAPEHVGDGGDTAGREVSVSFLPLPTSPSQQTSGQENLCDLSTVPWLLSVILSMHPVPFF